MVLLSAKSFILLLTFGSVTHLYVCFSTEDSTSEVTTSKCQPLPSKLKPPDFEGLTLDEILHMGIIHMDIKTKNTSIGATFVFGNVGAGKSTVVPLMLGDLEKLSVGYTASNYSVIYRDENTIGRKEATSLMRMFPDYYVSKSDKYGQAAFWDFPGFNYSRSLETDLAQLYFLKKALEISKSANFIFTITQSNVLLTSGVGMLATYATTLLKDARKFKDSIGLIVTDVIASGDRREDEILYSIRNSLRSYVKMEKHQMKEQMGNGSVAKGADQILQRIWFIEGLLEEKEEGGVNKSRIYFINSSDGCDAPSKMAAKLMLVQFSGLKYEDIVPEDFGIILRADTVQEIKNVMWAKEIKGISEYAVDTSQGILKELQKAILRSKIENPELNLINEFKNAFNRHFGRIIGRSLTVVESTAIEMLDSTKKDIDFYISCASQRMKSILFLHEIVGDGYPAVPLSKLSQPFIIAGLKLSNMSVYYNFCNETYHALGEYSKQSFLRELKRKNELIHVDRENILDFLATANVNVPEQISATWKNQLDDKSKQFLVDLVRKQIPEIKFSILKDKRFPYGSRLNVIGRNVMLSEVMDAHAEFDLSGDHSSEINVAAVERFFIDRQVERTSLKAKNLILESMSVVAPVWDIIPTKTGEIIAINLDGESEEPGQPWSPHAGGNFFGVYSKIINGKKLFISANGGSNFIKNPCGLESISKRGYIHLYNTSGNVTIRFEACPGTGAFGLGPNGDNTYMPSYAISSYTTEFMRTSLFDCFSSQSEDFFNKLASYAGFTEMELKNNSPLLLASELETLEQEYYAGACSIENCPEKVERRMTTYYKRKLKLIKELLVNANTVDTFAYTWIGSLIIGRLISSRKQGITLNVTNTEEYFAAIERDLKALEINEHKVAIYKEKQKYNNALDEKIQESQTLSEASVSPAVDNAQNMIREMNSKLLSTLDAFLNAAMDTEEDAKIRKMEFEIALPLKHFMSALRIIGTACRYLGPVESAVGGLLTTASSIGNSFIDGRLSGYAVQNFTTQLTDLTDEIIEKRIAELSPTTTPTPIGNGKEIEDLKLKIAAVAKVANAVTLGAEALDSVIGVVVQIQSNNAQFKKLEMAVQEAEEQSNSIKNLKDNFHKLFVPGLDAVADRISEEIYNLNRTLHSGLMVKKFQMKNILKDMQQMGKGFAGWISDAQNQMIQNGETVLGERDVYESFLLGIETLDMAILVLSELYDKIEMYQERKEFADFIEHVSSPTTEKLMAIGNDSLRASLARVSVSIKINLAVGEYKKAEQAFKQWVFPFPNYFLKNKKELELMKSKNLTDVLSFCRKEINRFRNDLRKSNVDVSLPEQYLYRYNFISDRVSTRPFYIWSNEKWRDAISRLFRGETIQLKADVDMIGQLNANFFKYKAAIKFKNINIFMRARDRSLQPDLDAALSHYKILLTHSGVSIYKVNGEHFVMRDKARTYSYNFKKNIDTNLLKYNVEGPNSDILQSPYTWWTIKMSQLSDAGHENLHKYASTVDLVLEGEGTYLDEYEATPSFLSELNLSDHYETYEPNGDKMGTTLEIPTKPSQRRCRPTLSILPHSVQAAPKHVSGAIFHGNQESGGINDKDQTCYPNPKYVNLTGHFVYNGNYYRLRRYLMAMGYSADFQAELQAAQWIQVRISKVNSTTFHVETWIDSMERNITFQFGTEFETLLYDGRAVNNTFSFNMKAVSVTRIIKRNDFEATNRFAFTNNGFTAIVIPHNEIEYPDSPSLHFSVSC